MLLQLVATAHLLYQHTTFTMAESNSSTPQSINTQCSVSSPEGDELAHHPPRVLFRNIDDAIITPSPADMAVLLSVVNHEDRLLHNEEEILEDDQLTVGTFSTNNNCTIKHIGDDPRNSAKAKARSAFMHCNYFLRRYMPTETKKKPKEAFIPLQDLNLSKNPSDDGDCNQKSAQWFSEMIGCFFYYLANEAYVRCKPAYGRIAYNSATGYASSVKSYLTNKFRDIPVEIPAFKQSVWASYRAKLLNAYHEEGTKSGKSLTNPHKASTAKDWQAIAVGCMWQNSSGCVGKRQFFVENLPSRVGSCQKFG